MTLCGLSVRSAEAKCRQMGLNVVLTEVRSKKGVPGGDEPRVIRFRMLDETTAELAWSLFLCAAPEEKHE